MATKSQMEASITERTTGSLTVMTWEKHAEMLKTEEESFLENIYSENVVEDSTGTHLITTPNMNFGYELSFNKIGRCVFLTGTIRCLATSSVFGEILSIDLTEYECIAEPCYGIARNILTNEILGITISGMSLKTVPAFVDGENFAINLTYKVLN